MTDDHVDDVLAEMRPEFLEHAASLFEEIEHRLANAPAAADPHAEYICLVRAAHSLKGAGGTFGFPDLTDAAADVERLGHDAQAGTGSPDSLDAAVRALGAHLSVLRHP
jgi:chemotaxis protein histidine kinase CheA